MRIAEKALDFFFLPLLVVDFFFFCKLDLHIVYQSWQMGVHLACATRTQGQQLHRYVR